MSDQRQRASSGSQFEQSIGFSRAVRVGNMVSVSGTAPIGLDGKTFGVGDIEAQTRRCFQIIERAIQELGGAMSDIYRTRMFVTDVSQWPGVAKVHGEIFGTIRPAATCIEVSGLIDPDWLVEIEAEAWIGI